MAIKLIRELGETAFEKKLNGFLDEGQEVMPGTFRVLREGWSEEAADYGYTYIIMVREVGLKEVVERGRDRIG